MQTLTKYLSIALTILLIPLMVYTLYLTNQRNKIQHNLENITARLTQTIDINKSQQNTIEQLQQQAQLARDYTKTLNQRIQQTEQTSQQLQQQFTRQQHENKAINTWANQSLPDGLY